MGVLQTYITTEALSPFSHTITCDNTKTTIPSNCYCIQQWFAIWPSHIRRSFLATNSRISCLTQKCLTPKSNSSSSLFFLSFSFHSIQITGSLCSLLSNNNSYAWKSWERRCSALWVLTAFLCVRFSIVGHDTSYYIITATICTAFLSTYVINA